MFVRGAAPLVISHAASLSEICVILPVTFHRPRCRIRGTKLMNDLGTNEPLNTSGQNYQYKPPKHSASFLEHLNIVKKSWPSDIGKENDNETENETENDFDSTSGGYGVFCKGEPSIDPSRQIQNIFDGESEWV